MEEIRTHLDGAWNTARRGGLAVSSNTRDDSGQLLDLMGNSLFSEQRNVDVGHFL